VNDVVRSARESGGAALVVLHDRRQGENVLDRSIELERGVLRESDASRNAGPVLVAGGAR
jgi:hypothetical protein